MGGVQGATFLLSKKNTKARISLPENVDKDQYFWKNVLWTDYSKIELF